MIHSVKLALLGSAFIFPFCTQNLRVLAQHEGLDGNGDGKIDDQGPAAFLFPPDRVWFEFTDNNGPCGSPDGPGNRTEFPMTNGAISLVQQDEAWDVQIAISYASDPKADSDFEILISPERIRELDPGHRCLNLTDPPSGMLAGNNATIQVRYTSDFDEDGKNETYYACADITYVPSADFDFANIPCFNVTIPEVEPPESTTDGDAGKDGLSGSGLSGGAVAGIVVGSVVGVAAVAILLFFKYRHDQREKRALQHGLSPRNVKWTDGDRSASGATGTSENSVALKDLSR